VVNEFQIKIVHENSGSILGQVIQIVILK